MCACGIGLAEQDVELREALTEFGQQFVAALNHRFRVPLQLYVQAIGQTTILGRELPPVRMSGCCVNQISCLHISRWKLWDRG